MGPRLWGTNIYIPLIPHKISQIIHIIPHCSEYVPIYFPISIEAACDQTGIAGGTLGIVDHIVLWAFVSMAG